MSDFHTWFYLQFLGSLSCISGGIDPTTSVNASRFYAELVLRWRFHSAPHNLAFKTIDTSGEFQSQPSDYAYDAPLISWN
jgi:hypothetical protein